MKDEWYGDKRDLVKWGVLLHLAATFKATRILQVPYYGQANGAPWRSMARRIRYRKPS
jgi:hypothetical protein